MKVARFIASGFGAGFAPVAPGTVGSIVGLLIGACLLTAVPAGLTGVALMATTVATIGGGLWAISAAQAADDPGWVVIDEIAGQLIAISPLARLSPIGLLAAFLLFRLFDITKPGPVGWMDRRHDAIGVMGDDVAAGLIAAAILVIAGQAFPAIVG